MSEKKLVTVEDEQVDGAQIAANIIKRFPQAHRERITKRIQSTDPHIMQKISARIFTFEDIASLTPPSIQLLIMEIDHQDLLIALKKASDQVRLIFFNNMSQRKLALCKEDLNQLKQITKESVDAAQQRILAKIDELRARGAVRTQQSNDVWA